jgi:hypothetical protein
MTRYNLHIIAYKHIPYGAFGRTRKVAYVKPVKEYAESEEEAITQLQRKGFEVVKKKEVEE